MLAAVKDLASGLKEGTIPEAFHGLVEQAVSAAAKATLPEGMVEGAWTSCGKASRVLLKNQLVNQ